MYSVGHLRGHPDSASMPAVALGDGRGGKEASHLQTLNHMFSYNFVVPF